MNPVGTRRAGCSGTCPGRGEEAVLNALMLGATGATGRHLVEQAVAQATTSPPWGDPTKVQTRCPDFTVVRGDVKGRGVVERTF
jgi:predicted ATPase